MWFSYCSSEERKDLQKITNTAQKIIGARLPHLHSALEHQVCLQTPWTMRLGNMDRQTEKQVFPLKGVFPLHCGLLLLKGDLLGFL
ncbi:hypothetical protein Q5P01_003211 [Channa striata]|uniref:Uncharacterized protein n=1 Tax=Channa striata TaxID=64152 RepID=A0AA88NM45_CHASR|nr:hypothetical protein Q5P01_003211 [Channa striata]